MMSLIFWLILSLQAYAATNLAGPPRPWPFQNPEGYSGTGPTPANASPVPSAQNFSAIAPPVSSVANPSAEYNRNARQQEEQQRLMYQRMQEQYRRRHGIVDESEYVNGGTGTEGSHTMDPCGKIPEQVTEALEEAKDFKKNCALANFGDQQKIVINDYSYISRPPNMYIFSGTGECIGKTAVTYGSGKTGKDGKPLPCSEGHHDGMRDGEMTPPGFHLTAKHDCPRNSAGQYTCRYGPDRSLLMVGLEGQNTAQRGVLIHPAEQPGTATSWGCSGVGCYPKVREELGFGSLVYNYFGDTQLAPGCRTPAGWAPRHSKHHCGPRDPAALPPQNAGSGSSSTSR